MTTNASNDTDGTQGNQSSFIDVKPVLREASEGTDIMFTAIRQATGWSKDERCRQGTIFYVLAQRDGTTAPNTVWEPMPKPLTQSVQNDAKGAAELLLQSATELCSKGFEVLLKETQPDKEPVYSSKSGKWDLEAEWMNLPHWYFAPSDDESDPSKEDLDTYDTDSSNEVLEDLGFRFLIQYDLTDVQTDPTSEGHDDKPSPGDGDQSASGTGGDGGVSAVQE